MGGEGGRGEGRKGGIGFGGGGQGGWEQIIEAFVNIHFFFFWGGGGSGRGGGRWVMWGMGDANQE